MTWCCPNCTHLNRWWLDVCEGCNTPTRGFDPKRPDDPQEIQRIIDYMRNTPMTLEPPDCGCPPYGTCNNTDCPRRPVVWC